MAKGFGKLFVPFGKILATPLVMRMKVTAIFTSLGRRIVSETGLFFILRIQTELYLEEQEELERQKEKVKINK